MNYNFFDKFTISVLFINFRRFSEIWCFQSLEAILFVRFRDSIFLLFFWMLIRLIFVFLLKMSRRFRLLANGKNNFKRRWQLFIISNQDVPLGFAFRVVIFSLCLLLFLTDTVFLKGEVFGSMRISFLNNLLISIHYKLYRPIHNKSIKDV